MKRCSTSHVIRGLQTEQGNTLTYLPEWQKHKILTERDAGEELEERCSLTAGGNAKRYSHLLRLPALYKTKHNLTLQSNSQALSCLPKWAESVCPYKILNINAYNSFMHNCQNLEATTMSFSRCMDQLWNGQTMDYSSPLERSGLASHESTWRNPTCTL